MLSAGQTFSRYVIEAPIGEGGMGEVYRAYDEKLRRKVALKVLHPDLAIPDAAERLVREARAAATLAHPNTIAIYDLGEIDGTVFVVMELVNGAPLRAFVGDPRVPARRKLRWLVDIARGLSAAHKAGLVHRDVKPANIMISDEDVVKVLDFGLAKTVEASSFHTDVGLVVGTPRYMAPELFTGTKADGRSDQYAFGVTAYELLSGVHPGGPTGAVAPALDTVAPDVSAGVARIVARTLSLSPADRFASMDEIAGALEAELHGSRSSAAPATRREGVTAAPSVALASTELAPPDVAPRALRTISHPMRPLAADLAPRRSVGPVVVVVAFVVAGGIFGAYRMLGARVPSGAALAPSTSSDGAIEADVADVAAPAPDDGSAGEDGEDGGTELAPESFGVDAAAGEADADPAAWPSVIDDFQDPWSRKRE